MKLKTADTLFIAWMRRHGLTVLRFAIGIVFVWFGILKVLGVSPVAELVERTYSFFPQPGFIIFLGLWEIAIGLGLIFHIALRVVLALLWLQMFGTFAALFFDPSTFFTHSNIFLLTTEGEFVIKNLVFIAASIVLGGYEVDQSLSHGNET